MRAKNRKNSTVHGRTSRPRMRQSWKKRKVANAALARLLPLESLPLLLAREKRNPKIKLPHNSQRSSSRYRRMRIRLDPSNHQQTRTSSTSILNPARSTKRRRSTRRRKNIKSTKSTDVNPGTLPARMRREFPQAARSLTERRKRPRRTSPTTKTTQSN
jgi:hypothetical protein